jgi:predicted DCC family thiol-disulfide oxidoreductase YuxK
MLKSSTMPHAILLYDGVCGLCNRFVQFILRHDRKKVFRFASLQSDFAARILASHGVNPGALDTVYVVLDSDSLDTESRNQRLLSRSDAVLFVLQQGGTGWRLAASIAKLMPRFLRDAAYNAIARYRYRLFGRSEACTLPSDRDHSRFLDL